MSGPVLRAPPLGTRIFKLTVLIGVGAVVVAVAQWWFFPWLREYTSTATRDNAHERLQNVFAGMAISILALSGYFLYLGVRVVAAQQWPLPNALVLRDTPIRTGRPAMIRGFALIVLAACMALLAIWSAMMPSIISHR